MFKKILVLVFIGIMAGCATVPTKGDALIVAGKSLLTVRQAIVSSAQVTDGLCRIGTLDADTCSRAKTAYEQAKPAYDKAVVAYLRLTQGGDQQAFDSSLSQLQAISSDMDRIAGGAK